MRRAGALAAAVVLASCTQAANYEAPYGPRYTWAAPATADPYPGLRVVTFNIRYALEVEKALALLREDEHLRAADVIALQEMDAPGVDRIAHGLGMSYVYYPAAVHPHVDRDFGNAVLVRGKILADGKVFLPHLSVGRGMQRVAVWADVDVDGVRFRMYSLHVSADAELSRGKRLDQARAVIAAAASQRAVVVAGDFNDRDAPGEAFALAGYEWVSRGLPPTVSRWFTWDHIFTRGLRLAGPDQRGVVDNRGASDHRPIWADLVPVSTAPRTASTPAR